MATYPVVNKQTGEHKEVVLSIHDWDQWKQDNPDWERDWSDPSTLPGSGEVGDWRDKMKKTHPGFHDIIRNKIGAKAPRNRTIHDKYN
jgi:hypothetical protein